MMISQTFRHFVDLVIIISTFVSTESTVDQKLPDHNDTFRNIRANNKLYVDKSEYAMKLLESESRFYRMCRPGRFGKSNFLQMLDAFFRGEKALFEGLAVYEKHDWQKVYSVIYLDFSSMDFSSLSAFQRCLDEEVTRVGISYGIELDANLPLYPDDLQEYHAWYCGKNDSKLGQLMDHLTYGGRDEQSVVVLIDEYDCPQQLSPPRYAMVKIRDRTIFRNIVNPFLHQFERLKRYVRFLFATCTTMTSHHSRSRNQYPDCPMKLQDLTFDPKFSQMIGLSGTELKKDLKSQVNALTDGKPTENFDSIVQRLRKRYNGYCFSRQNVSADSECRLFNFHSVMTCLRDKNLDYLWHPAGDPKYNIIDDYQNPDSWTGENAMRYISRVDSDSFLISREELEKTEHVHYRIPMKVCMVLFGYLTLRDYDERSDKFTLDFPNEEIRQSFERGVLKFLLGREISKADFVEACKRVRVSMVTGDAKNFVDSFNRLAFKPADAETDAYLKKYPQMIYSPERIIDIFKTCDLGLRENAAGENDDDGGGGFEIELYNELKKKVRPDGNEYASYGLKVNLSKQTECWIRIEFQTIVSSAMNVLLKELSDRPELVVQNRTVHLMGINIEWLGAPIKEWIWISYTNGNYTSVQTSHPHYSTMYKVYITSPQAQIEA